MADTCSEFSEKSACPKCGCADVMSSYRPHIDQDPLWYDRTYKPVGKWPTHEYIHRRCRRCGYDWPEACVGEHQPREREDAN